MTDLWSYLTKADKPIVMYGMGNGADKILDVCAQYGIEVSDFFASDGFVRGHLFHGKRVLSYSEIKEKYGKSNGGFIVLMSFASSRPEVLENVKRIASECELYLPDVPVTGEEIFNLEYARAHAKELAAAYELLYDTESKRIFENIIYYKISGDISYLWACESSPGEAMNDILKAENFEYTADFGAYNGDSVRELALYAKKLKKVYALEPDRHSYKKLCAYAECEDRFEIISRQSGAWSKNDTLFFDNSGNRNAHFESTSSAKKSAPIEVVSPDFLLKDEEKIDYIKYDVEGSEKEALLGTSETIARLMPSLLVSAYHRSCDIFSLPLLVNSLCPDYKLYLRRFRGVPAWDINLYAVK